MHTPTTRTYQLRNILADETLVSTDAALIPQRYDSQNLQVKTNNNQGYLYGAIVYYTCSSLLFSRAGSSLIALQSINQTLIKLWQEFLAESPENSIDPNSRTFIFVAASFLAGSIYLCEMLSINPARDSDELLLVMKNARAIKKDAIKQMLISTILMAALFIYLFQATVAANFIFQWLIKPLMSNLPHANILGFTIPPVFIIGCVIYNLLFSSQLITQHVDELITSLNNLNKHFQSLKTNPLEMFEILKQVAADALYRFISFGYLSSLISQAGRHLAFTVAPAATASFTGLFISTLSVRDSFRNPAFALLTQTEIAAASGITIKAAKELVFNIIRSLCYTLLATSLFGNIKAGMLIGIALFATNFLVNHTLNKKLSALATLSPEELVNRKHSNEIEEGLNTAVAYENTRAKAVRKYDEISATIKLPTAILFLTNTINLSARFARLFSLYYFNVRLAQFLNLNLTLSSTQNLALIGALGTDVCNTEFSLFENAMNRTIRDFIVSLKLIQRQDATNGDESCWASFYKLPQHQIIRAYGQASPFKHNHRTIDELHNEVTAEHRDMALLGRK